MHGQPPPPHPHTHTLVAPKLLISLTMTEGLGYRKGKEEEGMIMEFIDIK